MAASTATLDMTQLTTRELNQTLQTATSGSTWSVVEPRGLHSVAAGLTSEIDVTVQGHVGYYCAGMNQAATVKVTGNAGPGVAENMMSGMVQIHGNASQYAGATARGGLLHIGGNASSRCGISMKGVDIIVEGNVGHMSAFMAQAGNLVVCGDAGNDLGDSIYEANLFIAGTVNRLGADCIEKDMRDEHHALLNALLTKAGIEMSSKDFKRFGSARRLYHFNVDNADAY